MLTTTKAIRITCDGFLCGYDKTFTEDEYQEIQNYDGKTYDHFPSKQKHREMVSLKNGKCPWCEEAKTERLAKAFKGGILRKPINSRINKG